MCNAAGTAGLQGTLYGQLYVGSLIIDSCLPNLHHTQLASYLIDSQHDQFCGVFFL